MNKERPLQHDLFTGELVDARTPAQKKRDQEREQPQQTGMFSARDVAQFGVSAHPLLPISEKTRLTLISQDPRTPEEQERDKDRQAQRQTSQLFPPEPPKIGEYFTAQPSPITDPRFLLPARSLALDQAAQKKKENDERYNSLLLNAQHEFEEKRYLLQLLHRQAG